ncbi:MAG: hypothetical protein OXL37_00850 [Chloroflexota bacterium]|nr:hypothetical protein [Chloroflexota bacterium]MDE2961148.1 hypothetical protein [Chloroflexota bacterium]
MTAAQEIDPVATEDETSVELIARVVSSDGQFLATVDGLELQSTGRTREAAENGLVQAVRGWLERQDTVGRLGQALGRDDLTEETEIVLRFAYDETSGEQPAGG